MPTSRLVSVVTVVAAVPFVVVLTVVFVTVVLSWVTLSCTG